MRKRLERKNNCEVCEIRHGVMRGQTGGRRSRGRTRYIAMEWEFNTYHTLSLMPSISGSPNADDACSEVNCCVALQ